MQYRSDSYYQTQVQRHQVLDTSEAESDGNHVLLEESDSGDDTVTVETAENIHEREQQRAVAKARV